MALSGRIASGDISINKNTKVEILNIEGKGILKNLIITGLQIKSKNKSERDYRMLYNSNVYLTIDDEKENLLLNGDNISPYDKDLYFDFSPDFSLKRNCNDTESTIGMKLTTNLPFQKKIVVSIENHLGDYYESANSSPFYLITYCLEV